MKKGLVAALAASFILSIAGTAFAFPVEFNGNFKVEGRVLNDESAATDLVDTSFWFFGAKLNFGAQIDKDTKFFGRISHRANMGSGSEINIDDSEIFDQYGIVAKSGSWDFSIGRQAVSLGQGLIIDTGNNYAGVDNKFDGVVATGALGSVDTKVILGKNTDVVGVDKEWYGASFSKALDKKVTAGAAYAYTKESGDPALKVWALNAAVKASDNLSFNAEYAKSNAETDNSAYVIGGTYTWAKDSFTLLYSSVKGYSVDQENSGFGNIAMPMGAAFDYGDNVKGITAVYSHPVTKTMTFNAIYLDLKAQGEEGRNKELAGNLTWKF